MNRIHDRTAALDFLMGRINYERTSVPYRSNQLKLDRMARLLSKLGDPHLRCPTIHIAGTKGKGSTAAMTAQILTEAGLKTGLYTSPHLERLEERFAIDGRECSEAQFVSLTADVQSAVADMDQESLRESESGPTFFEITTALAWMAFARERVDCAVIEVGLGGRLDSTNVCAPTATAITSISLDHTRQLGDNVVSIAREKAGIIKPGVPVVMGVLEPKVAETIESIANERGCAVNRIGNEFSVSSSASSWPQRLDYVQGDYRLANLELPLVGEHQVTNAALAIYLARCFCERTERYLSESAIRAGLSKARCPARVEVLSRKPMVVLDAAHNPASAIALRKAIEQLPGDPQKRTLIFATSRDKDAASMLAAFGDAFSTVVLTRFADNPRTAAPEQLRDSWTPPPGVKVEIEQDATVAWRNSLNAAGDDNLICVAGSFFLAAELRSLMRADLAVCEDASP